MSAEAAVAYSQALERLRHDLTSWFPGVVVMTAPASVPAYADYNSRDQANEATLDTETSMVVVTDAARTGTLAFVPLALYERGEILASVAPAGTLAAKLRPVVLEILVLRRKSGETWVCLGRERLPTGRFPTLSLRDVLARLLAT